MFMARVGVAEVRSCSIHGGLRNCFRCLGCNSWYCEDECDLVHTCYDCGGGHLLFALQEVFKLRGSDSDGNGDPIS